MITALISRTLNFQELEKLDAIKKNLFKIVRKHKRKITKIKLYLNGEKKYESRTVMKGVLRTVTGRLWGSRSNIVELTITYNQLSNLIDMLDQATKNYLELVKKI